MSPSPAVTVRTVELGNKGQLKTFIRFPWKVYEDDPNWVPPLIFDQLQFFNPGKNPYFLHSQAQLFMAYRDGEPVGRISAHENTRHIEVHKDGAGFFGFFECINDREVAAVLFNAAAGWLREKGYRVMRGPMSFSVHHEVGLLIDAFDQPPVIRMTYNPRYYVDLIEDYGFRKAQDLYAYRLLDQEQIPKWVYRVAEFAQEDPALVVRTGKMKDFEKEKLNIKKVYREAWEENWGAIPLTDEEFEYLAQELKLVLEPNLTFIAEYNGQPVGMSMVLPDLNPALRKANGRLLPFGLIKILLERRKCKGLRMPLMGVLKKYRHMGIDAVFYVRTEEAGRKKGYTHGELSWILESNTAARGVVEKIGAKQYKTYRIYDKPL